MLKNQNMRTLLLAGVSVIALSVASPEVRASDMPTRPAIVTKAPPAVVLPTWTFYLEGAGFWTGGDSPFGASQLRPKFGWEAAAGIDYRFAASPWHISVDFRYGRARDRRLSGAFSATYAGTTTYAGAATVRHKESHWVADFAIGRDVGIGSGQHQAKLGIRIAELKGKTNAAGTFTTPTTYSFAASFRSKFLGVGPRLGLQGSFPLQGPWSLDYAGGVAILYGNREFDVSVTLVGAGTASASFDSKAWIPNADVWAGLSYAFTPNFKLTAGYRFDGYWDAMRMLNSSLAVVNNDRFFHGPFIRATARY